jgi:O-antigen ligase
VQSDLARFAGWCFLAGVFLMVTGDGLTNFGEPFPARAWPWLYLLPFVLACVAMLLAGRIGPRKPARAAVAYSALAGLLAVFALSTLLSQDRTLSATALGCVAGIVVFWWFSGQMLEDSRLLEATWIVAALAVLELAIRVIVSRLNEGLDQIPLEVRSVTWLGKLQIAWVFNLFGPFLLARFIGDQRWSVSLFNGAVWAVVGLANYLLLSRMGLLVFVLATLGVCLLNAAHWRRWIVLMGTAAAGAAIVIANNLRITAFVASTFLDRVLNSGIDLRLRVWEEAWAMFQTHPIAGIGLGTFDKIAYQMPATEANRDFQMNGWHAHNVPLHILTEAGVLGLAAWVFLWYVIVRALVRAWRTGSREQSVYAAAALVSVAAFQILSMTEVLIAARVQASLQMNLLIALLLVLGLRMSLPPPNRRA